jgi:hypothetical protein
MAAAVVLALGLVGLVVREGRARAAGREVVLEATGYDPRSLLTGHYVRFQLRSDFPPGTPCPPGIDETKVTWVALRRQGDHHVPSGGGESRAEALRLGEVAVKGNASCWAPGRPAPNETPHPTQVSLDLGVDRLHTDQAQAEAMQAALLAVRAPGMAKAYAVISVGGDGKPRLKAFIVAGKRTNLDWF